MRSGTPVLMGRSVVLAAHAASLAAYGGASGLRDEGLLESALAKPKNLLAYGEPDLADLAASYAFGLARNHPFVDGNKRASYVTAVTFLEANGFEFTATEDERRTNGSRRGSPSPPAR